MTPPGGRGGSREGWEEGRYIETVKEGHPHYIHMYS